MYSDRKLRRPRWQQRGLTLIEVVLGLAILSLMAGAIYGIIMGSVDATASLASTHAEDRRLETFLERTRTAFAHFPQGATVELRITENEPLQQELTLRGVRHAFLWGERPQWEQPAITLAPRPWPDDRTSASRATNPQAATTPPPARRFSLAMTTPEFYRVGSDGDPLPDSPLQSRSGNQLVRPDEKGRFWMDLLPEIQSAVWRFWDPGKKQWIDQQGPSRPGLIELQILLPGRRHPVRAVFTTS